MLHNPTAHVLRIKGAGNLVRGGGKGGLGGLTCTLQFSNIMIFTEKTLYYIMHIDIIVVTFAIVVLNDPQ